MNATPATIEQYQIKKLPIDLADAVERYAETFAAASKMTPKTFLPLRLISLLDDVTFACDDMREVLDVAIDILEKDSNADAAAAVLKGARAMNSEQSNRIWELVGLVLRHMVEHNAASSQPAEILAAVPA